MSKKFKNKKKSKKHDREECADCPAVITCRPKRIYMNSRRCKKLKKMIEKDKQKRAEKLKAIADEKRKRAKTIAKREADMKKAGIE